MFLIFRSDYNQYEIESRHRGVCFACKNWMWAPMSAEKSLDASSCLPEALARLIVPLIRLNCFLARSRENDTVRNPTRGYEYATRLNYVRPWSWFSCVVLLDIVKRKNYRQLLRKTIFFELLRSWNLRERITARRNIHWWWYKNTLVMLTKGI